MVWLTGMALLAPLCVGVDLVIFQNRVQEISLTELTQTSFLLISGAAFLGAALRAADSRGFYLLASGLFTTMLIREQDRWLGSAWLWLALVVTGVCVAYVYFRCRNNVWGPLFAFIQTKPYYLIAFGMVFVVVFSRLFGSGSLIWKPAMGTGYSFMFKSVLQEGLELFGYTYILAGSVLVARRVDQGRPLSEWKR